MAESDLQTEAVIERVIDTISSHAETIGTDPDATVVPTVPQSDADVQDAVADLGDQARELGALSARLAIESRLGKGGMGEVMLAEQRSVGRKVAVKRLAPGRADDKAIAGLLREGWVTGTLEHPNVMPLYDMGLDEDGRPLVVLKRIEGVVWRDLMADAGTVKARFGMDLLQWNLQILTHLCNALGFAHAKGILHRDVKPDNVMIGEFGEVYLLDWGIAVSLGADGTGRLPAAKNVRDLAGTPAYLAPEMLEPGPGKLTPRTDVYLLGAVLCEILTGEPPHRFETFEGFVRSVVASKPDLPDDLPDELAGICRRAMAASAADRYATTDELRLALQTFLAHRGSAELEVEARVHLRALEELLRATSAATSVRSGVDEAELRLEIYERFSACRFGFRQALQTWDGNEAARHGLQDATRAMVEYELDVGHPRAAAGLLAELSREDAKLLRVRVERALEAMHADEAEFERLRDFQRGHDRRTGRRSRRVLLLAVGAVWCVTPTGAWIVPDLAARYETLIAIPLLYLAIMGALRYVARRTIDKSFISRSIVSTFLIMLTAEIALSMAGALAGIEPATLQTLHFVPWLTSALVICVRFTPELWFVPLGYAAGLLLSAASPDLRIVCMVLASANMTVGTAIWAIRTLVREPSPENDPELRPELRPELTPDDRPDA